MYHIDRILFRIQTIFWRLVKKQNMKNTKLFKVINANWKNYIATLHAYICVHIVYI